MNPLSVKHINVIRQETVNTEKVSPAKNKKPGKRNDGSEFLRAKNRYLVYGFETELKRRASCKAKCDTYGY